MHTIPDTIAISSGPRATAASAAVCPLSLTFRPVFIQYLRDVSCVRDRSPKGGDALILQPRGSVRSTRYLYPEPREAWRKGPGARPRATPSPRQSATAPNLSSPQSQFRADARPANAHSLSSISLRRKIALACSSSNGQLVSSQARPASVSGTYGSLFRASATPCAITSSSRSSPPWIITSMGSAISSSARCGRSAHTADTMVKDISTQDQQFVPQ